MYYVSVSTMTRVTYVFGIGPVFAKIEIISIQKCIIENVLAPTLINTMCTVTLSTGNSISNDKRKHRKQRRLY